MAIKINQSLKQTQNITMTPQLQQAIKLLTLTHLEMTDVIATEMVENPMLEERGGESSVEEIAKRNSERDTQEATADSFSGPELIQGGKDQFDWDKYVDVFNNHSSSPPSMVGKVSNDELPNYENIVSRSESLTEHLEWQLRMEHLLDEEKKLAAEIIYSLNDDGYLTVSFDELIKDVDIDREDALEILKMIQAFDPVGCGARDLRECLLIQARNLDVAVPLVEKLIENHLEDLYQKNYKEIQAKLGVEKEEIKNAELCILNFHPKPGRLVSAEEIHYIVPDIYVHEVSGEFTATLNDEGVPRLRISNQYRDMLKAKDGMKDEEMDFIQDKIRSAVWLIKSIENRQKTILKVANAIIKYQPEFFKKGISAMRPMVLRDIAGEIGMHESTVSRVTTNKFMHTPIGIFELKFFFNSGVGDVASESLKLKIKELIDNENKSRPLSDQRIVDILTRQDIDVARRTVAKYREMMNILPSSKRKQKE